MPSATAPDHDPPKWWLAAKPARKRTEVKRYQPSSGPEIPATPGGYRSSIAASLLQQLGFSRVSELAGGLAAWEAAGLPLTIVAA